MIKEMRKSRKREKELKEQTIMEMKSTEYGFLA
jgi:hypothetical protein